MKKVGRAVPDERCKACHATLESLAHILNACPINAGMMRSRHSTILRRLTKVVPENLGNIFVEQKISDSPGNLRPDLVIINDTDKVVRIVDVTIPFIRLVY